MNRSTLTALTLTAFVLLAAACSGGGGGGDDDDETPTPSPTPTPVGAFAPFAAGLPVDGRWLLSPNVGTFSVNRIQFRGPAGNSFAAITTPTCVIDFDRTSIAFTTEADCQVMLPPGSYQEITLFLDP